MFVPPIAPLPCTHHSVRSIIPTDMRALPRTRGSMPWLTALTFLFLHCQCALPAAGAALPPTDASNNQGVSRAFAPPFRDPSYARVIHLSLPSPRSLATLLGFSAADTTDAKPAVPNDPPSPPLTDNDSDNCTDI